MGCRQFAPMTGFHHSWGPASVSLHKQIETDFPSKSGISPGSSAARRGRSARVTYPVALTNCSNCAFVTSVRSSQNPSSETRCRGSSSASTSAPVPPIVNVPPGIQTMPAGLSGSETGTSTGGAAEAETLIPARRSRTPNRVPLGSCVIFDFINFRKESSARGSRERSLWCRKIGDSFLQVRRRRARAVTSRRPDARSFRWITNALPSGMAAFSASPGASVNPESYHPAG